MRPQYLHMRKLRGHYHRSICSLYLYLTLFLCSFLDTHNFSLYAHYWFILEMQLSYDPSVGRSVDLVGCSVCHNFLSGAGSYSSMILSEHLYSHLGWVGQVCARWNKAVLTSHLLLYCWTQFKTNTPTTWMPHFWKIFSNIFLFVSLLRTKYVATCFLKLVFFYVENWR